MQEQSLIDKTGLVLYCDGSARPNPGYAGFGVFGHYFKHTAKPKSIKHPLKTNLYFNYNGISKTKESVPIEVIGVVEAIYAIEGVGLSNNYAELLAVTKGLELALSQPDLTSLTIYTDSNYTVEAFNKSMDEWNTKTNWRRQDGKDVAHIPQWKAILSLRDALLARGTQITLQWVKAHSDDYGNEMADLYSVIGSNAARVQMESAAGVFCEKVYLRYQLYKDFKASYDNKDFVYHFKDLFFNSSEQVDDRSYCFLSSTEDDSTKGRRATDSIFLAIKGYVPELINRIKDFYRSIPRLYTCTCCIKLNNLDNRDILRVSEHIPVPYLLVKKKQNTRNIYSFVNADTAFLEENTMEFPFIMNINKLYNAMQDLDFDPGNMLVEDFTDVIVKDAKIQISNKDRFLDLNHLVQDKIEFTQKLLIGVGYDMPNYLALKKIETELTAAHMALHKDHESDHYTVFVRLTTASRQIYSLNVPNKFLAFRKAT